MEIIELFKQPIFKIKLNEDLKEILKFCIKTSKNKKGVIRSNIGGFHSDYLDTKEPVLNSLINNIKINSNFIIKNILKNKEEVNLTSIWFNMNEYKDFNLPHNHPFSKISGVFYIKVPKNSGNIVFLNDTKIENYLFNGQITEYNNYNSSNWSIKPEENILYLFPSWLNHYVQPNFSNEKRVSISFNLN
jgi:uncharacterized protein (TIGR02466 family)